MGTKWATNLYLPVKLSEEDIQKIPSPYTEMTLHVTYKTIEAGTFLGMGVFGPITAALRRQNIAQGALKGGRYGALVGLVAGPLMTYAKFRNQKELEPVWDRCYRLRLNRNQVRSDRMITWAAIGGTAAAYYMGARLLDGGLVGVVVGGLTVLAYNIIHNDKST